MPARAHVNIPLIYCCGANAYRVLLAEKSPGELQQAHRGKEGIARQLQRAGGTQSTRSPGSLPHTQPGDMLSPREGDCGDLGAEVD